MTSIAADHLDALLGGDAFIDYVYSYPHKSAYRPLTPRSIASIWHNEPKAALFAYMHVPFCEMRCGFCNLFTATGSTANSAGQREYIYQLRRQAEIQVKEIGAAHFVQGAIGGGTPTILAPQELSSLLDIFTEVCGIRLQDRPVSIETSPGTATNERLEILAHRGIHRVSIGIQSLHTEVLRALKRPEDPARCVDVLNRIGDFEFPCFNADLIYGAPGQTPEMLCKDIDSLLRVGCSEMYLYPLYVREKTILGNRGTDPVNRSQLYRAGRDHLRAAGWQQQSLRCFQAPGQRKGAAAYRCQEDGMLGLGIGARSYTDQLHYSHRYAVSQPRIRSLIADFMAADAEALATVNHGFELDETERRRRFFILSLLEGQFSESAYLARFAQAPEVEVALLRVLAERGLVFRNEGDWCLTDAGTAASDCIGHWLFSDAVRARMAEFRFE